MSNASTTKKTAKAPRSDWKRFDAMTAKHANARPCPIPTRDRWRLTISSE